MPISPGQLSLGVNGRNTPLTVKPDGMVTDNQPTGRPTSSSETGTVDITSRQCTRRRYN
jgi:hypothetical protein